MTKTAFIVLKSPEEQDPAHFMTKLADRDDASVLLLEDGVYQAIRRESSHKLAAAARNILVSLEDVEARGFSASDLQVGRAVGYPEIVDCIMDLTERTVTI